MVYLGQKMQCMSNEDHRFALRTKAQYSVLEKRLSNMCVDRTEWIVEELSLSVCCTLA